MNTMKQQRRRLVMRTTLRTLLAMTLGLCALLGAPEAARAQYSFTPINIPDATFTAVNANTTHAIAGEFDDQDGNTHGFVLSKGVFTQIDAPDAEGYTSVNGINAKGDRVGLYLANGSMHGYFWRKDVFTTLDPPDSTFSAALFVNTHGQVVGFSTDAEDTRHGFVWRKGVFATIDAPGAGPGGTKAIGINDRGQIVGAYRDEDQRIHGFLLHKGVFTTIDAPGAEGGVTVAQGINNAGTIVGFYVTADNTSHGFVRRKGVYTTIDVPDSLWTEVYSINAKGEIVGAYEDAQGIHGFLGKPARKQQRTN